MSEVASTEAKPPEERSSLRTKLRGGVLALIVLVVGGSVCVGLLLTGPETEQESDVRSPRVVKTVVVEPSDVRISITAYGSVIPARQVVVQPEVRGRVVRQHTSLEPGGVIEAGAELVSIDPSDYKLALVAKQAALEEARFALAVERGRQVVALREWTLLEGDVPKEDANRSLVLRKPHLRRAEALVEKAENDIALAELDLARTSVTAPFNAVVIEESVEVGQLLERGTTVTTLAGADEFWVRVSVSIDRLGWIQLPKGESEGAKAKVVLDTGEGREFTREGRVLRLLGDLGPSGRMARMLVSIPDPLGRRHRSGEVPLLLGSYVQVEIDAGVLKSVVAIRRAALHEGNRIWVVDEDHSLQIREVDVLWSRKDSVLLPAESIRPGERLVVSGLRVALPGMRVSPQAEVEIDGADKISRSPVAQ